MKEAPLLKPRTVVEIYDAAFRLYRENFWLFLGILSVAYVPIYVLQTGATAFLLGGLVVDPGSTPFTEEQMQAQVPAAVIQMIIFGLVVLLLAVVAIPLSTGALVLAVGDRYLNQETSLGKCYSRVLRMFLGLFMVGLLSGLVVGLGMLFCLVPGIIFAVWFALDSEALVLEKLGPIEAMGRSRELSRGHFWRIVGLFVIMVAINLLVSLGMSAGTDFGLPFLIDSRMIVMIVGSAIQQIVALVIAPYFAVAWVLLYYDIRIRKEAFDLEVLAKSMGAPSGPSSRTAPAP